MEKLNEITVTQILDIKTVPTEKGVIGKMVDRPGYGILFCEKGKLIFNHNGKKIISDAKHAVLFPKGSTYTRYDDENGLLYVINFDCLEKLCDEFVVIEIEDTSVLIRNFERMQMLSLFERNRAKIMSIFYDTLDRIVVSSTIDSILIPALKYIEKNYNDPNLKNEMLANECKISEIYFRKLFLRHLKTTPKQFVMDVRIQKAKQLLEEGNIKINSVAEQCGFASPYHFCRFFKKKTGITPTEYMKQNKMYKI